MGASASSVASPKTAAHARVTPRASWPAVWLCARTRPTPWRASECARGARIGRGPSSPTSRPSRADRGSRPRCHQPAPANQESTWARRRVPPEPPTRCAARERGWLQRSRTRVSALRGLWRGLWRRRLTGQLPPAVATVAMTRLGYLKTELQSTSGVLSANAALCRVGTCVSARRLAHRKRTFVEMKARSSRISILADQPRAVGERPLAQTVLPPLGQLSRVTHCDRDHRAMEDLLDFLLQQSPVEAVPLLQTLDEPSVQARGPD